MNKTQITNILKECKIKITPQKIKILEIIFTKYMHLSAKEIYELVKIEYPSISFSTVYNSLEKFVQNGLISQLSIKKDRALYVAYYDWETFSHHHFYCYNCHTIYNLYISCPIAQSKTIEGHKIFEAQAYLYGICEKCLKKEVINVN